PVRGFRDRHGRISPGDYLALGIPTGLRKKTQQHDERRRRPAPPRACLARPREITRVADFRDFGSRCDHPPHSSESDGLASAAAPQALRPRLSSKLPLRMLMKTFDYVGIVA